ncbi:MAG TPA: transcription termination/antitermination NusG family protein [Chloroflexota bacterium]|jgi:transcriptional antiterminator RfaH
MKQWYVLRAKPRRESFAEGLLARAGIEVFVPRVRVRQRARLVSQEPLFPGYFFARLDATLGQVHMASYTPGVLHVVGFGGQATPVPDALVEAIGERLARGGGAGAEFSCGDRVVITRGPMKDVEAVFDRRLSAAGRVQVLIQVLERVCRAEVGLDQLRRAG